jgi:cytochrome P450
MLHFPDVLARCHAELDRVVGRARLPTFDDKASLPYTRAVILETQRWRTLTPIGVAHALTQDDEYDSCLLPKGSIVYPNLWCVRPSSASISASADGSHRAMSRDETVYPEPEAFRPERFLTPDGCGVTRKNELPTFGFGRRLCSAVAVAEATLFIHIATLLWAFDFQVPLDAQGERILPSIDVDHWDGELVVCVAPG